MRTILYTLVGVVVIAAIAVGGGLLLLGSAMDDMCGVSDVRMTPSPDGKLGLFVFTYDCGATTGYSTLATIQSTDTKTPNARNAFYRTTDRIDLPGQWQSNVTLKLTVPVPPADRQSVVAGGVTVIYQPL
jgi:hypothetical protein